MTAYARQTAPQREPARGKKASPALAVIFHRIGPYHFARLRAAGRLISGLMAIELCRTDSTYAWDLVSGSDSFERLTLFESHEIAPTARMIAERMRQTLCSCQPEVVAIPGWADAGALAALDWCVESGVPAVVMSESTQWDGRRTWWKEWAKSRTVGLCSAALAGGAPHADYLAALGMPRGSIALGYDAVDNEYFSRGAAEARRQERDLRKSLGLPEKFFLASMRFVEKKNAPRLLQAFAQCRQSAPPASQAWDLVILGDGPLNNELKQAVASLGLTHAVHFPGFKQYHELPTYYGLASAFVHPSTVEQWGLVVNEAMASGLPVLVSEKCGCASDLVREGRNGFTFDPFDVGRAAELMTKLSSLAPPALDEMGKASQKIIAAWGPGQFAQGMRTAMEAAKSAPLRRSNPVDRALLKALSMRSPG